MNKFAIFKDAKEQRKAVARPRKLPPRTRPQIADVLKLPHASEVLNPDGSLKKDGPHIAKTISYWKVEHNKAIEVPYIETAGSAHNSPSPTPSPTPTPTPSVFTPGLPADIGNLQDYSSNIIFSSGNDSTRSSAIQQWAFADCWFLAVLDAIAIERPDLRPGIIQADKTMPGRYVVNMYDSSMNPFQVKITKELGDQAARPSPITGEVWACLVEKAEAFARTYINQGSSQNTYASTNWGFQGEAMRTLGFNYSTLYASQPGVTTAILAAIANRQLVVGLTPGQTDGSVIAAHCYSIYDIHANGDVVVVNPWGVDGTGGDGNNDGYVTISALQFASNFSYICITTSAPNAPVIPGDGNGDGVVDLADFDLWFSNVGKLNPHGPFDGDFNNSGIVDAADFDTWFKNVGSRNI